jgi:hypothetical protein
MSFLITLSGPLFAATGLLLDVQVVFWAGVAVCGFNLFMNLASGVMKLPLIPSLIMLVAGAVMTPWFWGAALGLVCWTALEAAGEVFNMHSQRRARRAEAIRLKTPPRLPYRCGTMLFRLDAEGQMATSAAWVKTEEKYCAWVDAHANPKPEWVARAKSIRRENQYERNLNKKIRSGYRKAAEQGDADAQSNLGLMYGFGRAGPQDSVLAYMWANLAAAQGSDRGKENRDIVAKRMTSEQIAEAQRLAREWKPK